MCKSPSEQPAPDESEAEAKVAPQPDVAAVAAPQHVALLTSSSDGSPDALPAGINVRSRAAGGRLVLVSASLAALRDLGVSWRLQAVLGTDQEFKKIFNAQRLLEAAAAGDNPKLEGYITLDAKRAPRSNDAILSALRQAGANPQTVAGNVVTAQIPLRSAGAVVALHWVHAIELSGKVAPR